MAFIGLRAESSAGLVYFFDVALAFMPAAMVSCSSPLQG
jgi:hypothetical protein